MKREDVIRVVEAERAYQDAKWPTQPVPVPPSDELRLVRQILNQADAAWYVTKDLILNGVKVNPADLDAVRKIAAVCIRCMENHGAVQRGSTDVIGNSYLPGSI